MIKGLLLQHLNSPCQAYATAAMAISAMSIPMAFIGAVRLMIPTHACSYSAAIVPALTSTTVIPASLFVALRINTLIYSKNK